MSEEILYKDNSNMALTNNLTQIFDSALNNKLIE